MNRPTITWQNCIACQRWHPVGARHLKKADPDPNPKHGCVWVGDVAYLDLSDVPPSERADHMRFAECAMEARRG